MIDKVNVRQEKEEQLDEEDEKAKYSCVVLFILC